MKHLHTLILVLSLSLGGVGCGDDDPTDAGQIVPAELVGTWNATSLEFTRISDPSQVVEAVSDRGYTAQIVINADGSSVTTETIPDFPAFVSTASIRVTGNTIVSTEADGSTQTFTYSVDGNTLTLLSDNIGFDFEEAVIDVPATFVGIFERL